MLENQDWGALCHDDSITDGGLAAAGRQKQDDEYGYYLQPPVGFRFHLPFLVTR